MSIRKERVGVTQVANVLGVSVTTLKEAVRHGKRIKGAAPPAHMVYGTNSTQYYFFLGDLMDCLEEMKAVDG